MSKLKTVLVLLLFFSFLGGSAQNKETYLLFNNGVESQCTAGTLTNKSGEWKGDFMQADRYDKGSFIICRQHFRIKKNSVVEEVEENKIDTSKIMDIARFIKEGFETDGKELTRPNKIFKKIYVIEKTNRDTYMKFEVEWTETFID